MNKKTTNQMARVLFKRHKSSYQKSMTEAQKKSVIKALNIDIEEKTLCFELNPDGDIGYFFRFKKAFMGEFHEHFFYVSDLYCEESMRKKLYARLKKESLKMKKETLKTDKVKRMAIEVSFEDEISKKHFSKKGMLTYIELLGNTKEGLSILKKEKRKDHDIRISLLQKKDINKLIALDLESHLKDKTSRMHKIFKRPDAKKGMRKFYLGLLKNKSFLVAKVNNQLAGDIGFFFDKKRKLGLIAAIFVAHKFQGQGVSKALYQRVLEEFNQRKLPYYLGATTTDRVLSTAKTIGRKGTKWAYITKI